MSELLFMIAIIGMPSLLLSIGPAVRKKSWIPLLTGTLLSAAGIVVPLFTFWGSGFLLPDWKGDCRFGAVDCFHVGKFALIPLVLWACAAFYKVQILGSSRTLPTWVALGIFNGMVVSSVCAVFGFSVNIGTYEQWGLIIPLYTAAWYWVLFLRIRKGVHFSLRSCIWNFVGLVPFWAASVMISKQQYLALPDEAPDCFVVTAASRGHGAIVGPFTEIAHAEKMRVANRQLLRFWRFEEWWDRVSPRTHRGFRRIYNRVGPCVARRIRSPWLADGVYLLLKPLEWFAFLITHLGGSK